MGVRNKKRKKKRFPLHAGQMVPAFIQIESFPTAFPSFFSRVLPHNEPSGYASKAHQP